MIVQLLDPGTHFAEEVDDGEIEFEIRSNPHPVTVRLLSKANHEAFERDDEYEYLGPDDAKNDHEFEEYLDPDEGPWFLLVMNEHPTAATAVGTESFIDDGDEDDEEDDEEEDETSEDDEEEDGDEDEEEEDETSEDDDETSPPSGNA